MSQRNYLDEFRQGVRRHRRRANGYLAWALGHLALGAFAAAAVDETWIKWLTGAQIMLMALWWVWTAVKEQGLAEKHEKLIEKHFPGGRS